MVKLLIFGLFLTGVAHSANEDEFMVIGSDVFSTHMVKKSKWIVKLGADYAAYPTILPEFKGEYTKVKPEEDIEVYMTRVTVGREFYLGANFSFGFEVAGSYGSTKRETDSQAAEDIDYILSENNESHEQYGLEASASLLYTFETRYFYIQPYIQFNSGAGFTQTKYDYYFEGLEDVNGNVVYPADLYDMKVNEGFAYVRPAVGLAFVSRFGVKTYFEVSQFQAVINDSDYKGKSVDTAGNSIPYSGDNIRDAEDFSYVMYSVGFGVYF